MSSHADEETKSTDVVMADAQPPALAAAPAGPISAASIAPATPAAAQNVIQMFLHHLQAAGLDLRKCLDDGDREHQRPTRGLHQSLGGGVPPWRLDQPHSFKNRLERHCATLSPADILQSDPQPQPAHALSLLPAPFANRRLLFSVFFLDSSLA
jgi:hypothetical protein